MFKPQNWLDRVFEIGIIAKGLNGAVELLGGLLLLFVSPAWIHQLAISVTRVELSEDPHDFIATHLLHTTSGLTGMRSVRVGLPVHARRRQGCPGCRAAAHKRGPIPG